jgi:hypothetical protein
VSLDFKTFEPWLVIISTIKPFHELAVLFSFLGFYLTRCEFYLERFLMRRHCTNSSNLLSSGVSVIVEYEYVNL